jgi:glyoxylate/hydroxypyruvate reductase
VIITVPFVHSLTPSQEDQWLEALNNIDPLCRVLPLRDLSALQTQNAKIAIVANPDPNDLKALRALEWVQSLWAGVEKLMPALAGTQIEVARLIDARLAQTMSDAVLTWVLHLYRDGPLYLQQQRDAIWQQWPVARIEDTTVGVLGLGELGSTAAKRLAANGFRVHGWSRSHKQLEAITTHTGEAGLSSVLSMSDILVVLLPATPHTHALLNAQRLSEVKQGASLINFARASVLDHDALTRGLASRAIKHAVLDVFDVEPLPSHHPLWANPNVTILPHISAPTDKSSASACVIKTIMDYQKHGSNPLFVGREQGY